MLHVDRVDTYNYPIASYEAWEINIWITKSLEISTHVWITLSNFKILRFQIKDWNEKRYWYKDLHWGQIKICKDSLILLDKMLVKSVNRTYRTVWFPRLRLKITFKLNIKEKSKRMIVLWRENTTKRYFCLKFRLRTTKIHRLFV